MQSLRFFKLSFAHSLLYFDSSTKFITSTSCHTIQNNQYIQSLEYRLLSTLKFNVCSIRSVSFIFSLCIHEFHQRHNILQIQVCNTLCILYSYDLIKPFSKKDHNIFIAVQPTIDIKRNSMGVGQGVVSFSMFFMSFKLLYYNKKLQQNNSDNLRQNTIQCKKSLLRKMSFPNNKQKRRRKLRIQKALALLPFWRPFQYT